MILKTLSSNFCYCNLCGAVDLVFGHRQDVASLVLYHVVEVVGLSDEHDVVGVVHAGLCHRVPDAVLAEDTRVFSEDSAFDLVIMDLEVRPIGALLIFGDEKCHEEVVVLDRTIKKCIDDLALGTFQLP